MKIGIDARCLEWNIGGVTRYLINMLKLWPQISKQHKYVLFFQNHIPQEEFLNNSLFECILIKGPKILKTRRIVGEQLLMPFAIKQAKLDLFFAPWYSAPLLSPCSKTVIGCWDVSCNSHGAHYSILERISFGFFSPRSCQKAQGIITCSQYDSRQIQKYFRIPAERICVVQFAADDKFKPVDSPDQLDTFRAKYGLPKKYILSMGIIIKRRSVDVVIDAFKEIYRDYPDLGLVVIGRNATVPFVDIQGKMQDLIEQKRGFYFLRAPEEDVANFYRGAWYYICTTTTDGESLMLKEAMKCGTPVITSTLLKETAGGNAVILDDPTDCKQTVAAFRKVALDQNLRDRYSAEGIKWMQPLSWEKVARESLQFLESR
ncbi:MAG: glycosyltransferase family 1 protein [Candidatus Omnitrophica bacterium]|nr:glycosyltransferase family 1 protein [Candidatus Omnitrophota bacterium]